MRDVVLGEVGAQVASDGSLSAGYTSRLKQVEIFGGVDVGMGIDDGVDRNGTGHDIHPDVRGPAPRTKREVTPLRLGAMTNIERPTAVPVHRPLNHELNKETQLCISMSGRPSNIGTRFHNRLYAELNLNYVYKAFSPTNLEQAVAGIRGLPIRGAAVSMPFKEQVIPMLDALDESAKAIDSVNTIVNDDGFLTGHNTDYSAVASLLVSHGVPTDLSIAVRGSGGMGKAVIAACANTGFTGTVVARNVTAGQALAERYGWTHSTQVPQGTQVLVNVTPLGMDGGDGEGELSFTHEEIEAATWVFDVVAMPAETPLIKAARAAGKHVITGAEVIALQAAEQFVLYTGVRPSDEQVRAASEYSRSEA